MEIVPRETSSLVTGFTLNKCLTVCIHLSVCKLYLLLPFMNQIAKQVVQISLRNLRIRTAWGIKNYHYN